MSDQNCKSLRFECILSAESLEEIENWLCEYIPEYLVQDFDLLLGGTARVILSFDNCSDAVLFKLKWC